MTFLSSFLRSVRVAAIAAVSGTVLGYGTTADTAPIQASPTVSMDGTRHDPATADATLLDPLLVAATRAPQSAARTAASAFVFRGAALDSAPALSLDSVLRSAPSFSLFRRTDSAIANPTTQGVSLRGLGPNGASRSLVLLDGVPLNDPFGGWIAWSKIPRDNIAQVEVLPGGGASAWGNAALSGVIQISSIPLGTPEQPVDVASAPANTYGSGRASASAGNFGTHDESLILTQPIGRSAVQAMGEDFGTHGYMVVAPERRGPVDVPAWSRHQTLLGRWRMPISSQLALTTTVRSFEETRGNGTSYQRNGSHEKFASTELTGQTSATFSWTAVAYAQEQSFASTFSSVNATRTTETPASDQFAVPATAIGASWFGSWRQSGDTRTIGGIDVRAVHGETRENYSFANGAFTRQRVAGGAQRDAGLFALHEVEIGSALQLTMGARLDANAGRDGHRRELDRATLALSRDDRYPAQNDTQLSPSLGAIWSPASAWRLHANAQQAFRRPTLNELYRPFRQGANVTEANPALRTERAQTFEAGVEWHGAQPKAGPVSSWPLTLAATVFHDELRDAVANVTLARGPGSFPLFGTLPASGIGRQRLNLDRIQVDGVEVKATWRVAVLELTAAYLYNDATVERATVAPALVGKRLAEVPRHNAFVGATWKAPHRFTFTARVRWIGRQFDDDENTLQLGEAVVADVGASRPLSPHLEAFLNVENAGNARVETARSADGIVNTGAPRLAFAGFRARW